MAYRMKSSGLPFKELGSSPAKQDKLTSKRPLIKEEKEENKKEEEKYRSDDALVYNAETRAAKKAENIVRKIEATKVAMKKDKAYDLKQRKIVYREALEEYYSKMDETDGKYKGKRPVLQEV